MDFTTARYTELIRTLLSPDGLKRQAADKLLLNLVVLQRPDQCGRWQGELGAAVEALGDERAPFLRSLIRFWRAVAQRTAGEMGDAPVRIVHDDSAYPLAGEMVLSPLAMYGMGIGCWLRHIGPAAADQVDELRACLCAPVHNLLPEEAALALGSIGTAARAALPELLAAAGRPGATRGRFGDEVALAVARVIGEDPAALAQLVGAIVEAPNAGAIHALSGVLQKAPTLQEPQVRTLWQAAEAAGTSERGSALLACGAAAAQRAGCLGELFLARARREIETSGPERWAAAETLALLGSAEADSASLVRLATDPDPWMRVAAYRAAACWPQVPPALIAAAAADLGNGEACDGEPHDSAVAALTAWGPNAHGALPAIGDLLARMANSGFYTGAVVSLLEALGPAAAPALEGPARAWLAELEPSAQAVDSAAEEESEDPGFTLPGSSEGYSPELWSALEEFAEMDRSFEEAEEAQARVDEAMWALADRIGFPRDAEIPGTPTAAEGAPMEAHEQLAALLAQWSVGASDGRPKG